MKIIQYLREGWVTDLCFIIDDGENRKYRDGQCNHIRNITTLDHEFKYVDPNFKEHKDERPFPSYYGFWDR